MTDWADEKAREWCKQLRLTPRYYIPSLAALLRELRTKTLAEADIKFWGQAKSSLLAEVRRVVEEEWERETYADGLSLAAVASACKRILSRLEQLK